MKDWEIVKIKDIASKVGSGSTPRGGSNSYKKSGIPLIRSQNIHFDGIHYDGLVYLDEDQASDLKNVEVLEGDVLLNITGASIGRVTQAPHKLNGARVNQHVCIIRTETGASSKFLAKFLASPDIQKRINSQEYGVTRQALTKQAILNFDIPLPPLNEQRRIVAKIEELTDRTRKAREALEDVPQLIEQFRRSVLAAAFRGDLTADWRKQNPDVEPAEKLLERSTQKLAQKNRKLDLSVSRDEEDLPCGWSWSKLGSFTNRIQAGKNFSCPEEPVTRNTVGLVKISAVTWDEFDPKETKTVTDSDKIDPKLFIQKGDFLISRANTIELVGSSVVVRDIEYQIMLSDKVWRVDFEEVHPKYVHYFLKSSQGRKEIESRATGNQLSMRNISQNAFKDIVIPVPPLEEQIAIVRHIESAFTRIQSVGQQRSQIASVSEQLDRAILAKAFRGQLVPQDPTDEPASILLDRIRSERQKTTPSPRKTKHRAPAPQRDRESAPT